MCCRTAHLHSGLCSSRSPSRQTGLQYRTWGQAGQESNSALPTSGSQQLAHTLSLHIIWVSNLSKYIPIIFGAIFVLLIKKQAQNDLSFIVNGWVMLVLVLVVLFESKVRPNLSWVELGN